MANKLTENEMLAIFEKLALLTLAGNFIMNQIPDDQFRQNMKRLFKLQLESSNNFCEELRKRIYNTVEDRTLNGRLTDKSEFIIKCIDYILPVASTGDRITFISFYNELQLNANRQMHRFEKNNPGNIIVETDNIKIQIPENGNNVPKNNTPNRQEAGVM